MTQNTENEEGAQGNALADDGGGSRRGMLKQIGLTAAALVAIGMARRQGCFIAPAPSTSAITLRSSAGR